MIGIEYFDGISHFSSRNANVIGVLRLAHDEQRSWLATGAAVHALEQAFSKLINLKTISIRDHDGSYVACYSDDTPIISNSYAE